MSEQNKQNNKERKTTLEPGLTIPVNYVRTVDGDTIEVEIRRKFKVRLRDINVAELNTSEGEAAADLVSTVLSFSNEVIVFIPTNSPDKLMDITSFERIVGDIYVSGVLLQDILEEGGYNNG